MEDRVHRGGGLVLLVGIPRVAWIENDEQNYLSLLRKDFDTR